MEVIFWGRPSWNPDEETKVACSALGCWRFQELWRLPGYVSVQGRPKVPWNPETHADDSGVPSMPLTFPPVREKSYEFFGALFESLWLQEQRALKVVCTIDTRGPRALSLLRLDVVTLASNPFCALDDAGCSGYSSSDEVSVSDTLFDPT